MVEPFLSDRLICGLDKNRMRFVSYSYIAVALKYMEDVVGFRCCLECLTPLSECVFGARSFADLRRFTVIALLALTHRLA